MKTTTHFLIVLISLSFTYNCYSQKHVKNPFRNSKDSLGRTFLGRDIAKNELAQFVKDSKTNFSKKRILITNKDVLISIAEPILFDIYKKENIIRERPYEIYLFDDYWLMMGTLPSGMKGGTFSIAINRKTCEVIGFSHGK